MSVLKDTNKVKLNYWARNMVSQFDFSCCGKTPWPKQTGKVYFKLHISITASTIEGSQGRNSRRAGTRSRSWAKATEEHFTFLPWIVCLAFLYHPGPFAQEWRHQQRLGFPYQSLNHDNTPRSQLDEDIFQLRLPLPSLYQVNKKTNKWNKQISTW